MTNNTTMIDLEHITGFYIPATAPKSVKDSIVESYINPERYKFIGFVDRTNTAILEPRFHNVRDAAGRFAKIRRSRANR